MGKKHKSVCRKLLESVITIACMISILSNNVWAMDEPAFTQESVLSTEQTQDAGADEIFGETEADTEELSEPEETTETEEVSEDDDIMLLSDRSGAINLGQYNNGGEIVLDADAVASGVCQLSSGRELTIDLNGHTLTMSSNSYFMMNGDQSVLNIKDSAGGGIIYASYQLVWGYNGGTVNLYGGILNASV